MSLDLVKKQKANIQKEKKRVTKSDLFHHPLAYQPIPKGKKKALREELDGNQKGTMDLLNCYRRENGKKVCPPAFKISPDRDAAGSVHSGIRPFVSGKKGSHVSDIFLPNKSHQPKKYIGLNNLNGNETYRDDSQSYPGYRGSAELRVKVVRNPGEPDNGLRNRLGDLDKELPRYDKNDIHNLEELEFEEPGDTEELTQQPVKTPLPPNFNPYGTTVKLSFIKELEPVQVVVEEEEEEIDSISSVIPTPSNTLGAGPTTSLLSESGEVEESLKQAIHSDNVYLKDPSTEFTPSDSRGARDDKMPSFTGSGLKLEPTTMDVGSKQANNTHPPVIEINSPIRISDKNVEEEEEPINIPSDYQPVADYAIPFEPNQKLISEVLYTPEGKFRRKVKNFWQGIQSLKPAFKKSGDVTRIEFTSGGGYSPALNNGARNHAIHGGEGYAQPNVARGQIPLQLPFRQFKRRLLARRSLGARLPVGQGVGPVLRTEGAKRSAAILTIGIIFALTIPIGAYVQKIIEAKNRIEVKSEQAFQDTKNAQSAILSAKPEEARHNFETAYNNFLSASETMDEVGGVMLGVIKVLPGGGKVKSGENLLEAGKHLTSAGQIISEAFDIFLGDQGALKKKLITTDNLSTLKEVTSFAPPEREDKAQTLTEAIIVFQEKLTKAKEEMALASGYIDKVNLSDVPEGKREEFLKLKDQIPEAVSGIDNFGSYSNVILSVLGHNQPKQYLFLFENNDEIRATGGFIGTYGIIKIEEGNISQLMIDGIYNPDGQLKERVIPPKPIQKMSATWSMHDANWWPDFPKSAEKVAWFYEKTGGPAVDGVIAFTPKLMEDFLKITGPINHEKYGVTITADNFVETTQQKVEKDYDRKLNRPKQILADLAPLVLEKIMSAPPEKWVQILGLFSDNLKKRNAVMYFFDYNVQKTISDLGWSGEILDTPKDYLSVVNTNISGQKTDKMIDQKITHAAEIKDDGSIVDNVTITRAHRGGKEKYDWYNAVNSNWLRVYVPKGSELLHAEGYTREVDSPPVDYEKLGFIEDEMVVTEESGTNVDPYTGTRVYEDSGKTVFANWTYVSPGETLTIKYSYLLPWKLAFDDLKKPADTYSLLLQKQAGDENSNISSRVTGLENFETLYSYPGSLSIPDWAIDEKFDKDVFAGAVLAPKGTKID